MGRTLVEIEKISKIFPGVKALQNVGFNINTGEIHALIGENGAGKSTLIKILSGVYQPEAGGKITMNGKVLEELTPLESLRNGIVVIYQDFSLFPNLSVMENIALGHSVEKNDTLVSWKAMEAIAADALDQLGLILDFHVPLGELSVAKQQLVAIARALANNAKLLILDEPTSSLSKGEVKKLFEIMLSLKKRGIALLFISHKLDELFAVSDRFTVLRDGQYIGTYSEDELDDDQLISLMVGRKIEYTIYPKNKKEEPLLEIQNFSKKGNFQDINFTLHKGEILGLTGLVGAGRTEVAQAIFGLNPVDEGTMLLDGAPLVINTPDEAVKAGIAYVPENRLQEGLVLRKSIEDNISLSVLDSISANNGLVDLTLKRSLTEKWMDQLGIRPNNPQMLASKLSGGNQQRVVISKWLATEPRVLIVDEPTNGIDIGAKSEIHQLLRELAASGLGILVISSELPEILAIADRVAVMRHGRIITQMFCEGLNQEDIMSKAL
ncbi:MAG: ABC transporter [Spirochaetaceae bacterium 4572_59]|nr:MAG: ABC transporter [Spirochaetaceae bacterium 4572_59]